jgi:hypothetical protein
MIFTVAEGLRMAAALVSEAVAAARHMPRPRRRRATCAADDAEPLLHHHAATRLAVGTLPCVACALALAARDALARLSALGAGTGTNNLLAVVPALCVLALAAAAEAFVLAQLRTGGPRATLRVALCAAALFLALAPLLASHGLARCVVPTVPTPTAATTCADGVFVSLLAPVGAPLLLIAGLPPRYAFPLELLRLGACAALALAFVHSACGADAFPFAWAARYLAKSAAVAAAAPVVLRALMGPDHPREIALLQLCPRALRPTRDALLALGARLGAVSALEAAPAGLLAAALAQFLSTFSLLLLRPSSAGGGLLSSPAHVALAAAWALAFGAPTLRAAQLHARRAARHSLCASGARRVHALHLRLSQLDADDPALLLTTAAEELLAAFPAGCSVAFVEWSVVVTNAAAAAAAAHADTASGSDVASAASEAEAAAQAHAYARLSPSPSPPGSTAPSILRVLARSPRPAACAALEAAARRGCGRRGSAAAALAKPGSCAGLTLDAEDFAEGVDAFADWASLCAPDAAGAGAVSLSLLGSGARVAGALWVHAPPAGAAAPAPAALRDYAECIGAVLLRQRAQRAALRAAAAAARADADATLALQRAFLSGITHELRTPLNAVVGFTSTVLEGNQLAAHDAEYLRCSLTAANTLLTIIDQLLDFAKWGQAGEQGGATALLTLADVPLRVRDVLDELVDVTGGKAATKGVSLCVQLDAGAQSARLRGDPARLRQVLVNLTGADGHGCTHLRFAWLTLCCAHHRR